MTKRGIKPVHPGVYLKELLSELEISQYRLAKEIGVPAMRVNFVVNRKRPVTADLALRLGRYFGQNPRYWINLQSRYDMDVAEEVLSERVISEVHPLMALTPKMPVEKRLAEGLADVRQGGIVGPFKTARSAMRGLRTQKSWECHKSVIHRY